MGCQKHLFWGPFRGVTNGGSGVSIGGVEILRAGKYSHHHRFSLIASRGRELQEVVEKHPSDTQTYPNRSPLPYLRICSNEQMSKMSKHLGIPSYFFTAKSCQIISSTLCIFSSEMAVELSFQVMGGQQKHTVTWRSFCKKTTGIFQGEVGSKVPSFRI